MYMNKSDDFARTESALKANPNDLPPQIHEYPVLKGTTPAKQQPKVTRSSLCKI